MVFDERGRLLTGANIPAAVALLEGLGVDAIGLNCGFGPEQMLPLVDELQKCCSTPDTGQPECQDCRLWSTDRQCTMWLPDEFAAVMAQIAEKGVWMVGGCCGTTPAHIAQS